MENKRNLLKWLFTVRTSALIQAYETYATIYGKNMSLLPTRCDAMELFLFVSSLDEDGMKTDEFKMWLKNIQPLMELYPLSELIKKDNERAAKRFNKLVPKVESS